MGEAPAGKLSRPGSGFSEGCPRMGLCVAERHYFPENCATRATNGTPALCLADAPALQQQTDPPIAEPSAQCRDLLHGLADIRIVGRSLAPHRFRIDTDQNACPALRDIMAKRLHPDDTLGMNQRNLLKLRRALPIVSPFRVRLTRSRLCTRAGSSA